MGGLHLGLSSQLSLSSQSGGGGAPASSYLFKQSYYWATAGNANTTAVDIGTAAANRTVIVATGAQNGGLPTVTVNGVSLVQQVTFTTVATATIFSALVPTGSGAQNVVITWPASAFTDRGASVWIASALASSSAKAFTSGNPTGTLNITSDDFLFAYAVHTVAVTFNGSTQVPNGQDTGTPGGGSGFDFSSADWVTTSSNASWSVAASGGTMCAASFK